MSDRYTLSIFLYGVVFGLTLAIGVMLWQANRSLDDWERTIDEVQAAMIARDGGGE